MTTTQGIFPAANFDHWSRLASWDVLETAALSLGIEPWDAKHTGLKSEYARRPEVQKFRLVYETAQRAYAAGDLPRSGRPDLVLAWAERRELQFPTELVELVKRRWPAQKQIRGWRKPEPKVLPTELPAIKPSTEHVATRERDSMLKLILGMAMAGYKYDPKARRGNAVREIVHDLAARGIPLSDDTIRKYLDEAAELLPPQVDV